MRNRRNKKLILIILVAVLITGILSIYVNNQIVIRFFPPAIDDMSALELERKEINDSLFVIDNNWLKKNEFGLWEMYLEGSPFEMGAINGILTKELNEFQENAFVSQIEEMIPNPAYLNFLKYFIAVFNRNMALHVPLEFKEEIYGVSRSASPEFNFISMPYHRMLNYHAAHDIGHALQNMDLVMCTAFGVKGSRSDDGELLIGRNFDLYIGDGFAKNKIITFVNPDNGYKFASVSWAGMIGVVSGMNEKGLTISYNSAKSAIPTSAKTPVSILARKIIQYAATIDEAYEIAKNHETFVSGSFHISSAIDNRIVVIEKTKRDIDIYETNTDELILTNHFQGEKFENRGLNIQNINEGSSLYRWKRTKELLDRKEQHDVMSFAMILRDQKGLNDADIGMGNEKAINQLIAHHSVIFKPNELVFWVSSNPYQLGQYVAYDLNKVFGTDLDFADKIFIEERNLPEDDFLFSQEYINFEKYKTETKRLEKLLRAESHNISEQEMQNYLELNPEFYYPHSVAGLYYSKTGNIELAAFYYNESLARPIPWRSERERIQNELRQLQQEN